MVAAMLEQASRLQLQGAELLIEFSGSMEALKRQVEAREVLVLIGKVAERLAGRPVKVRVELSPETAPPSEDARAPMPAPGPGRATAPAPAQEAGGRAGDAGDGLLEQARREPGVRKLMDAFGAHVVGIEPQNLPEKKKTGTGRRARPPEDSP